MALKDLFSRWTKGEDRRATERADLESRMTAEERAVDQEDFEARKEDIAADSSWAGREAEGAASGELDSENGSGAVAVGARPRENNKTTRRYGAGVVFTFDETHLPNAFDLLALVPYFALNAAAPAARSVLHDLAAAIVAA
jgi:hypothetical protein